MGSTDVVAEWEVPLQDGIHTVKFQHGRITGKRVILVDDAIIMKENWMFKLVGKEYFNIGKLKCCISIEVSTTGFDYVYSLEVNGKTFKKFEENQRKALRNWETYVAGDYIRVCLEIDTMKVHVNGKNVETMGEFVENGTETHFQIRQTHSGVIQASSTGNRRKGLIYTLFIDGEMVE